MRSSITRDSGPSEAAVRVISPEAQVAGLARETRSGTPLEAAPGGLGACVSPYETGCGGEPVSEIMIGITRGQPCRGHVGHNPLVKPAFAALDQL